MRLHELYPPRLIESLSHDEQEAAHQATLDRTGFWGEQGAGVIFMARSTGRFLLGHRSRDVEQPGTWGTFGGAIDRQETDPAKAAQREAAEETGYRGSPELVPLFVFKRNAFRYSNFLALVPDEFKPRLNWENQDARWCDFGDWPQPQHFGLKAILADAASVTTMRQARELACWPPPECGPPAHDRPS